MFVGTMERPDPRSASRSGSVAPSTMRPSTRSQLATGAALLVKAFAHALASGAVIAGSVAVSAVAYFGLLAWAIVTGSGIGGPLALPFLMLLAFLASFAAAAFVILPATLCTSVVCEVVLGWPRVLQIPIACALCFSQVLLLSTLIALALRADVLPALEIGAVVGLLLLVPLGVYWWVL